MLLYDHAAYVINFRLRPFLIINFLSRLNLIISRVYWHITILVKFEVDHCYFQWTQFSFSEVMARSNISLHMQLCIAWNKRELWIKLHMISRQFLLPWNSRKAQLAVYRKTLLPAPGACSCEFKFAVLVAAFFCCILIARCLEITEHLDICSIYCKRWK